MKLSVRTKTTPQGVHVEPTHISKKVYDHLPFSHGRIVVVKPHNQDAKTSCALVPGGIRIQLRGFLNHEADRGTTIPSKTPDLLRKELQQVFGALREACANPQETPHHEPT